MTDILDTQIRILIAELMDSAPQAPSLSELEWREGQMVPGMQRFPRVQSGPLSRHSVRLVSGAVVAVCAATAGLGAAGYFSTAGQTSATKAGSVTRPPAFERQNVISAVLVANQDEILSQTTEFVNPSGRIFNASRVLVDNAGGNGALEMLSASGGIADALVFNSGAVTHVDYADRVWWTVDHAAAGSPTLQDPESTASGVHSLVASRQLRVVSTTQLEGRPATELVGPGGPLPGSSLTLWVSESTDLPIQAIGTQSDHSRQVTTYQWLARTPQNLSLVTPTVPSGFLHVSGPPPGEVPASPLG